MRDSLVLNSTSLRGNLHIWVSTASLVGGFTSRSYSTSVRMWHSQYTGVRCVCCLLVGRPTLRLLVRSHGGRGADALGFRRISTSSERTGRLAHQPVVSGRLRTTSAACSAASCCSSDCFCCCCECSFFGKPAAPDRIRHTPLVAAYFFDGSVEAVSALANGTAGSHLSQMMRPSVSGLMGAVAGCVLRVLASWRDEELDWSLTGSRERGCGEREGRGAAW